MNNTKVLVCLYSDENFLSISILENLLLKNCYVLVLTDEINKWVTATENLGNKSRFSFINPRDLNKPFLFNYLIYCGGFGDKAGAYKNFRDLADNPNIFANKKLAILPFESFNPKEDSLINVNSNMGVVYLGDVVGPRIDINSNLFISRVLKDIWLKREISVPVGELIYPIFVADAAKTIAKWLVSFGPYGKEIFLLGSQVSTSDFLAANKKIIGDVKLREAPKAERRFLPRNYEIKFIQTNLVQSLNETYRWVSKKGFTPKRESKPYPKYFRPLTISVIILLLLPFILILFSSVILFISFKSLGTKNGVSEAGVLVAGTLFTVGRAESTLLSYVPGANLIYRETNFVSLVGKRASDIAAVTFPALKTGATLLKNVLGDTIYDPSPYAVEIGASLESAYQDVSELQVDSAEAGHDGVLAANFLNSKVDFDNLKRFFQEGKVFSDALPSFLGVGAPKSYLVLFQNNVELRPAGGFIGSYGILTFDGGRMSDLSVNDVYSADGQLRGHVEPPAPIKNYLGEANWWFRDSNWDPDFPTSAKRAEWFLDKEVDQKVDGVFAIDLNIIRDTLNLTGPIFLPDFNKTITSGNLYEETQAEAQAEFFPGSRQKASFLTGLSRVLVGEVQKIGGRSEISLLYTIFKNFEGRHVQVFLHDDMLQGAISAVDWGGQIINPACGDRCYADLIGITEANVGDNKANYFIKRDVNLDVKLNADSVVRRLTITYDNSANTALGPSGKYKVYIRIFVPLDSAITGIKAISGDSSETLTPDIIQSHGRYEVGVLTEVLPSSTKKLEFTWQTTNESPTASSLYGLYIRKQAGVTDDPWNITVTPSGSGLTARDTYSYNTVLSRDFFAKVNWLKQNGY